MSNVRQLLDIDPDYEFKRYKRGSSELLDAQEKETGEDEIFFSFMQQSTNKILNMKIKEVENRFYQFTYFEVVNEADI